MTDVDLLHIGYPKCASTTLQRRVFPRFSSMTDLRSHRLFRGLIDHVRFAGDEAYLEATVRTAFDEVRERTGSGLVVSEEGLVGDIVHRTDAPESAPERTAGRLASALPNAVVLVVIRPQQELLRSFHAHHVRVGAHVSFSDFVRGDLPSGQWVTFDDLDFHDVVDRYRRHFGADRVIVRTIQDLRDDTTGFIDSLAERLGTDRPEVADERIPSDNISLSPREVTLLRHFNRTFRRSGWNPTPLVPLPAAERAVQAALRPAFRRRRAHRGSGLPSSEMPLPAPLRERFARTNRLLAAELDVDLAAQGFST